MPAPANVTELIDLVRRSQIVTEDRLETELATLASMGPLPVTIDKLAGAFVRQGLLTNFQARQLLAGRWRRFMIGGKYKLLELLGAGGMGAVYLCEHIFMQRLVAIKVLPVEKLSDPSMIERFYREARAAAALNHPNIVRAFDIDQFEKLHFLVMEYVDGASLQEIVMKHSRLSVERAADYIAQTCAGLQHAHEAGMVHRDIKPGNLLVDRVGMVKMLDMGLARFFGNKNDSVTEKYDERSVLGTADYLAPEQALNLPLDIRADIYSLGATFHFLLTGQTIYPDGSIAQKLIWHQKRVPRSPREFRDDVPEEMAEILKKMLAKKPDDRFQQPYEIIEALARWRTVPVGPPPESEMPRLAPAVMNAKQQMVAPPIPTDSISGIMPKSNLRGSAPGFKPLASTSGSNTGSTTHAALRTTPAGGTQVTPQSASMPTPMYRGRSQLMHVPQPQIDEDEAEMAETLRQETEDAVQASMIMRMPPKRKFRIHPLVGILVGAVLIAGVGLGWVFWSNLNKEPSFPNAIPIAAGKKGPPSGQPLPKVSIGTPEEVSGGGIKMKVNNKEITSEKMGDRVGEEASVEIVVLSTGGNTNYYLNADVNFQSLSNFAIKLTPAVREQLKEQGLKNADALEAHFKGKRVQAKGVIVKEARGGVNLPVEKLEQLKILD